jgi:ribose transport system permease protein
MSVTTPEPVAARPIEWRKLLESYALLIGWGVLILIFAAIIPDTFFTWRTFSTLFGSQAVLVVLALALMIPLISGDFDLSSASTLVFSAMVIAVLNARMGMSIEFAIFVAMVAGIVIGAANAFFVLYFRIHSLIVTLGIGTFLNGMTLWISQSNTISGISMTLVEAVVITRFLGIPLAFYYGVAVALGLWYFLLYTVGGRKLLFVGRGREVARLNGIAVDRVRAGAFIGCGVLSAFAGVLYAGMSGSANPSSGLSLLLPAFAAVFLGATSVTPGRFNPIGTLVSVYFLITGITGLTMLGAESYVQSLFYGGALVVAVSLSQLVRNREPQSFG